MIAGRAGGGDANPVTDRADALWGHPERTIGARFDRIVRPLARPISFLGAYFYKKPDIPELRFQPIAILIAIGGFGAALFELPLRYLGFMIAFSGYPTIWAAGITSRLARAVPHLDERERDIRRKGREAALIVSLALCVCALCAIMFALVIDPHPGLRDQRPVILLFGFLAMLPAIFTAIRLLVIGWSAPRGGHETVDEVGCRATDRNALPHSERTT